MGYHSQSKSELNAGKSVQHHGHSVLDDYLLLRLIHILSAVVVAGTGAGIAFFLLMAYRSKNWVALAVTARHVILADWIFTAPAVFIQLVTGLLLTHQLGYSLTSVWFIVVVSLFIFIGLCWLPVVYIQYRIAQTTESVLEQDLQKNDTNVQGLKRLMRYWTGLGVLAFSAIIVMFWLMIVKPLAVV